MISRNEEKAISKVVSDIVNELPGVEVIVVDGSSDSTPVLARLAGAIVIPEPGGGYGPALNKAIFSSKRKFVATVDADDTYVPSDIKRLLETLEKGYDVVGGSRISKSKPQAMPLLNYGANKLFTILASALMFKVLHDIHSGMRVYNANRLREIVWTKPDLGFTVELLIYPAALGWKLKELPIQYRERIGESQLMKLASAKATVVSIGRALGLRILRRKPSNLSSQSNYL